MEKRGGHTMVNGTSALKLQNTDTEIVDSVFLPDPLKYTSVSLNEVFDNNTRFEASAFNLDAKAAKYKVTHCKYGYTYLWGVNGLVKNAFYGNRAKRNYVPKNTEGSIGFIGSSEMLYIYPKPIKYLIGQKNKEFAVYEGTILLSRSGTIGNVTYVNKTLSKLLVSEHAIRIIPLEYGGYLYAFLKTKIGKTLVQANIFGAVVDEIEPEHLRNIVIPNAPEEIRKEIHNLVIESYNLRDQSNALLDEAEKILYQELQLPPIETLKPKYYDESIDLRNYTTRLKDLNLRLDGSYHIPICKCIDLILKSTAKSIVLLGDKQITQSITLPGRFKRVYVDENNGVQFLGGKDIFQLNPKTDKYLSLQKYKHQIEGELKILENDILTPSRGTIGKVVSATKNFESKVISDNIINIRASNNDIAGYLYCFLNTTYGSIYIKRLIYGGVVDAMEPQMLANLQIPILKSTEKQSEINSKVLQANELRYQAFLLEQKAVKMMEGIME